MRCKQSTSGGEDGQVRKSDPKKGTLVKKLPTQLSSEQIPNPPYVAGLISGSDKKQIALIGFRQTYWIMYTFPAFVVGNSEVCNIRGDQIQWVLCEREGWI